MSDMFPIKTIDDLEKISKEAKWQYFEKLVGWVFEQNDFVVDVNKVFMFQRGDDKYRRQFDVIAKRFNITFLVECKKWSSGRNKTSAIKNAVKSHLEKCELYNIEFPGNNIPIIVTLIQEDIKEHDDIRIIPLDKLNRFIQSF